MEERMLKSVFKRKRASSFYQFSLNYRNYLNQKRLKHKIITNYRGLKLGFTKKQIEVLKLIANGYSNGKIAQKLGMKEATMKLLIYRLMKYLEAILYEGVDRFYLIIIAQELNLENLSSKRDNLKQIQEKN